jgi:hypothetical protein
MEESAVEWLVNELKESIGLKDMQAIEQAKEIEKAQHEKTWNMGNEVPQMKSFNQYFTETFIRNLH